ncbi:MAG TPA: hypothetical protein VGE39_12045 [Prosthecobacter sp.]
MKTLFISFLTFMAGMSVGVLVPWSGTEVGPGQAQVETHLAPGPERSAAPTAGREQVKAEAAAPVSDGRANAAEARDPFAAWEEALKAGKLKDAKLRQELLDQMAAADPERAWQMLMASGLPVSRADLHSIADAWYDKEPAKAAAFGLALTDPLQRPAFLQRLLTKWMYEKPGSFARWFHTQPAELGLTQHINSSNIVYRPGFCSLEDMDSLLRVNAGGSFADFLGGQVGALWAKPEQRQATMDWVRGVEDPKMRDTLWKYLVAHASEGDPQAAAGLLGEIGDERTRREASSTITAHLVEQDPQAAFDYAATLPEGAARQSAWQSAFGTWATREPAQALAYIQQNMASLRPELLEPAARSLGETRPLEALTVMARFPESSDRDSVLRELVGTWQDRQPVEARRWLESEQAQILPGEMLALWRRVVKLPATPPGTAGMITTLNGRRVHYTY